MIEDPIDEALYPEYTKLHKCRDEAKTCGKFLEWLLRKYTLAEYKIDPDTEEDFLAPAFADITKLLGEFFMIDLNKLEMEKRRMLNEIRKNDE